MIERLKLEEGWSTLFLIWMMIAVTAMAIMAAELTEGMHILMSVGTLGLVTGVVLAKSSFSSRRAHLFSLFYGIALIAYLVGSTLPGDLAWRERILEMGMRQFEWVSQAVSGGRSRDGLIFVLQTSAIFWVLGYTAAWYTFRSARVWRVVLPTGLVLLSVVFYYYGPKPLVIYLGVYSLLALLYVARTHLVDREKSWRKGAVRYEQDIVIDFMRSSLLIGVLVLLLAGNLPVLGASAEVTDALAEVDQPWRRFQDNWTRLFSSLRSYGNGVNDAYADSMTLGGPRSVGNTLIMDVYVPRPLPSAYWRGVALDTYDGNGGWENNTDKTLMHYPEMGELDVPLTNAREVLTQTVISYIPNSSTLYGAGEIVSSDREMLVDMSRDENEQFLVNWLRSRYVLRPGDSYEITSLISVADKRSLRQAAPVYPEWVTETYLQLPDTITPETKELAAEVMAPYNNVFDKAIAVRDYLRANIAYNDQIEAPPNDVEPVHYVLFESPEGFCTYYASAMVVMLRSQGIPARIVNGYAQGELSEDGNSYRVRANNAHSWVEVYFSNYGWIEFEPTAAIPVVERPEGPGGNAGDAFSGVDPLRDRDLMDDELLDENKEDRLADELGVNDEPGFLSLSGDDAGMLLRALGGGLIITLAGGLVVVANQFNRKVEADVEKSYSRLDSWARWLGILFHPVDTPYERADRLVQVVPQGRASIRNLTHQYVLRHFSPLHEGDQSFTPEAEWRTLRPLLLKQSLAMRWERLRKRARRL